MSDLEETLNELLRADAARDLAELNYLDVDTSHDKRRADSELEAAVYAQLEADSMLDAYLDEVWDVTFNVRVCSACLNHQPEGCGYCRDYDEAVE